MRLALLLLTTGCGRLAFDPTTSDSGNTDGGRDDGSGAVLDDSGVDGAVTCMPTTFACADGDLGSAVGALTSGSTTGENDDWTGTCGGNTELDVAFRWMAPTTGRWVIDTGGSSFDTILYARDSCAGAELDCNDDDLVGGTASVLTMDLAACQELLLVVDSAIGAGAYNLRARSKCPGTDGGSALGIIATGTNTGWGDSYTSSCGGNTEADITVTWTAPATGTFRFTTQGTAYDTVISTRATCTSPQLDCNDDDPAGGAHSRLDVAMTAGQSIVIVVDSLNGGGMYQLGVSQL